MRLSGDHFSKKISCFSPIFRAKYRITLFKTNFAQTFLVVPSTFFPSHVSHSLALLKPTTAGNDLILGSIIEALADKQ
jgi:hypothetical protein